MSNFNLNFPPFSSDYLRRGIFFQMFKTSPTPTPSMRLRVSPGHYWVNNSVFVDYDGGYSPVFQFPTHGTGNACWALLSMNSSRVRPQITYGLRSNNPSPPNCPTESLPLAWVYLEEATHGSSAPVESRIITHQILFDARPFFNGHRHFDIRSLITTAGSGVELFKYTSNNAAKFYTIIPGDNVNLVAINDDELRLDVVVDAELDFDSVKLLDMGRLEDDPGVIPNP